MVYQVNSTKVADKKTKAREGILITAKKAIIKKK